MGVMSMSLMLAGWEASATVGEFEGGEDFGAVGSAVSVFEVSVRLHSAPEDGSVVVDAADERASDGCDGEAFVPSFGVPKFMQLSTCAGSKR
eukprot:778412-Prorocentrum_minimum.AAC.1